MIEKINIRPSGESFNVDVSFKFTLSQLMWVIALFVLARALANHKQLD